MWVSCCPQEAGGLQAIAAALPVDYKNLSDYEYHSKDIEFHRRVAEATQNPLLVITINATTMVQELYAMTIPAPDKIRQELNNNLLQIYQAIVEQNVVQAEKAMAEHLSYYKRMAGGLVFQKLNSIKHGLKNRTRLSIDFKDGLCTIFLF